MKQKENSSDKTSGMLLKTLKEIALKLTKCILFWTAILFAVFVYITEKLVGRDLKLRVWIREPVTLLIAFGAAAGLLQIILHIKLKPVKIILCTLWAAAAAIGGFWGFEQYEYSHVSELKPENCVSLHGGGPCVIEVQSYDGVCEERHYEERGPFLRSTETVYILC